MASRYDDRYLEGALPRLFELHAEDRSYRVAPRRSEGVTASTSTVSAYRIPSGNTGPSSAEEVQAADWVVSASEVAAPKRGDSITEGSTEWRVFDSEPEHSGLFILHTVHGHEL